MFTTAAPKISSPMIQAIEDAVLFGNIKEIDGVLDLIDEEESFPKDIRYGLEALRYFRLYYGKGGILEAAGGEDRAKALQMESSWGRELISMIGHYPDMTESRYA